LRMGIFIVFGYSDVLHSSNIRHANWRFNKQTKE
jgi:hypothetical protein